MNQESESETSFLRQTAPRGAAHFSAVALPSALTICLLLLMGLWLHSCVRAAHAEAKPAAPEWAGLRIETTNAMTPDDEMLIGLLLIQ